MNTKNLNRIFAKSMYVMVILAMAFSVTGNVYAQYTGPKVGLVINLGGIYDNSFNSMAYQGLLQAEADLGIVKSLYEPADDTQFYEKLEKCALEGNELCIAVGFNYGVGLANAARVYTDTKWAIVDYNYPDCWDGAVEGTDCGSLTEIANVRGLKFNEKQVGYLAGVLAGRMTSTNVIGAVGGMEIPPVTAFMDGYRNGAQCTNSTVNVLTTYTGTFSDPDIGAGTAQEMISQGADIIFGVAGNTGNGAILYSTQNGKWAIGVDADQYLSTFGNGTVSGYDKLLSSAMKRVDIAVYQTIVDYVAGNFSSGTVVYDLAMNGVGLAPFHEADDSIPQEVKDELDAVRQGIIDGTINIDARCPWRDEFDGPLADGWYWAGNENPDNWGFIDGFLRIDASSLRTGGENLLLRSVGASDFSIETRMFFTPDTNFQFAGLVIWQDESNFLQFGRAFCEYEGAPCVGNGIYFDYTGSSANFATQIENPFDPAEAYLRLERRGEMVRAFYSHEGITWFEIGTHWIPPEFQVKGVGLTNSQNFYSASGNSAYFDYFEMTEGWGFLPEGFHDYDSGDFPGWACENIGVGGWAADPDDRGSDLAIEVNVDGTSLPEWLYASEYRDDLNTAGVCDGGNCSFSTSLTGPFTFYEPHSVVVYAQDIPSGDWVRLSNSPKTFTCRTYDIYAYDPLTGTTKQITGVEGTELREKAEYDPTWSPNGKFVAHDVVTSDSHQIYITDVKTGVSTVLHGTEDGGNDAAWSPNGKWIAFDRRWFDNDQNIYIVPATGGDRSKSEVVKNAVTASWAPNGKRIAFQSPDGSIRTAPVDGGKGGETLIAEFGGLPAWSPDGNWIAYSKDGDIWKVQVNVQGKVLGEPIQLTSGPFNDGKPTWSPDSLTIIYDSGFGQDYDMWSVPAAGGTPTWLTGAPVFGEYGPANARNSSTVAYASFSPDGQAPRLWVAAYTYDPPDGTFDEEGTYPYHFDFAWNVPEPGSWSGQGGEFVISADAEVRDGRVLLRGPEEIYGINYPHGFACEPAGNINPGQPTRFFIGWLVEPGDEITYSAAAAHFESITATAVWDDGSAELARHEIIPFRGEDWFNYVCTFTEAPPKMDLRVNYGHDWVESFYESGHTVSLQVTDSEGNVKATAEVVTEPKDFWEGRTGFQTQSSDWSPAQPDIQPYDWVYAQVDNGATAKVQLGDIQGEVRFDLDSITGTIEAPWITDPVKVECLDWGSGGGPFNKDAGIIYTNGTDPYSCNWNPETEWDVQPWQDIGVGYSTPDGHWVANAFRDERWMAFWTYTPDPSTGLFPEGEHSYYYQWAYTAPVSDSGTSGPLTITIAGDPTPIYDGYALIGPWGLDYPGSFRPQQAWTGSACEGVSVLHLDQPMRFVWGWVNDYSMTYEEALEHFTSLTIGVFWDFFSNGEIDGSAALATMSDLIPFTGRDARYEYLCTFTEHP